MEWEINLIFVLALPPSNSFEAIKATALRCFPSRADWDVSGDN
jgi:hypothetical protein